MERLNFFGKIKRRVRYARLRRLVKRRGHQYRALFVERTDNGERMLASQILRGKKEAERYALMMECRRGVRVLAVVTLFSLSRRKYWTT